MEGLTPTHYGFLSKSNAQSSWFSVTCGCGNLVWISGKLVESVSVSAIIRFNKNHGQKKFTVILNFKIKLNP